MIDGEPIKFCADCACSHRLTDGSLYCVAPEYKPSGGEPVFWAIIKCGVNRNWFKPKKEYPYVT